MLKFVKYFVIVLIGLFSLNVWSENNSKINHGNKNIIIINGQKISNECLAKKKCNNIIVTDDSKIIINNQGNHLLSGSVEIAGKLENSTIIINNKSTDIKNERQLTPKREAK